MFKREEFNHFYIVIVGLNCNVENGEKIEEKSTDDIRRYLFRKLLIFMMGINEPYLDLQLHCLNSVQH